jgi:hypothetical protein
VFYARAIFPGPWALVFIVGVVRVTKVMSGAFTLGQGRMSSGCQLRV